MESLISLNLISTNRGNFPFPKNGNGAPFTIFPNSMSLVGKAWKKTTTGKDLQSEVCWWTTSQHSAISETCNSWILSLVASIWFKVLRLYQLNSWKKVSLQSITDDVIWNHFIIWPESLKNDAFIISWVEISCLNIMFKLNSKFWGWISSAKTIYPQWSLVCLAGTSASIGGRIASQARVLKGSWRRTNASSVRHMSNT